MKQHSMSIEYPVTITMAYKTHNGGSARITRKIDEQYTALVEMVVSLLADDEYAIKACEVIQDAGLSEGPRQTYLEYDNQREQTADEGNGSTDDTFPETECDYESEGGLVADPEIQWADMPEEQLDLELAEPEPQTQDLVEEEPIPSTPISKPRRGRRARASQ